MPSWCLGALVAIRFLNIFWSLSALVAIDNAALSRESLLWLGDELNEILTI